MYQRQKPFILIAHTDPSQRTKLSKAFQGLGFESLEAASTEEAFAFLRNIMFAFAAIDAKLLESCEVIFAESIATLGTPRPQFILLSDGNEQIPGTIPPPFSFMVNRSIEAAAVGHLAKRLLAAS